MLLWFKVTLHKPTRETLSFNFFTSQYTEKNTHLSSPVSIPFPCSLQVLFHATLVCLEYKRHSPYLRNIQVDLVKDMGVRLCNMIKRCHRKSNLKQRIRFEYWTLTRIYFLLIYWDCILPKVFHMKRPIITQPYDRLHAHTNTRLLLSFSVLSFIIHNLTKQ